MERMELGKIGVSGTTQMTERVDDIQPMTVVESHGDKAALFLKENATAAANLEYSVKEERAVLRKIDMRILPIILMAYFFQQLDKSTLNYSSVFDITKDAHLVGHQFSWLGSILYLAELVAQPLAAFVLVKLPTGKVIACVVFLWGATLCIMAACTSFGSLLAMRFLLGCSESLITPSLLALTQMWWRRREQTMRVAYWNAMNGLTFIFGSLMTYGIGHIQSRSLYSYQLIFLFCGLLTVAYSVPTLLFTPDSPMEAKFLSEREKIIAVERLKANQMGVISRKWRTDHVREAFLDVKTWCWFFLIMAISIVSGGIGTFGSLIIKSFGYGKFQTILFNIPFGAVQFTAIIGSGWLATKIGRKGPVICLLCLPPVVGCVILLAVHRSGGNKGVLLFAYYIISIYPAITPLIYSWEAQNTAGDTKRKVTTAIVTVGLCTGNVIGPQLYTPNDAPLYREGLIANLAMFVFIIITTVGVTLYLMFLNKQHARKREALGKSGAVVDWSMTQRHDGLPHDPEGRVRTESDYTLNDYTELQNENFVFIM